MLGIFLDLFPLYMLRQDLSLDPRACCLTSLTYLRDPLSLPLE